MSVWLVTISVSVPLKKVGSPGLLFLYMNLYAIENVISVKWKLRLALYVLIRQTYVRNWMVDSWYCMVHIYGSPLDRLWEVSKLWRKWFYVLPLTLGHADKYIYNYPYLHTWILYVVTFMEIRFPTHFHF